MAVEMHAYSTVLSRPRGPNSVGERFVAIVGSAMKITDKINVLEHLLGLIDDMIITGGMAFTFKSVIDHDCRVGSNMIDLQAISDVERLLQLAHRNKVTIHLPTDHLIAENLDPEASIGYTTDDLGMPPGWIPLDIGMKSRESFSKIIQSAHTVLWVGTVGCFEWGPFSGGTLSILQDMIQVTRKGAYTLLAGGDAAIAARRFIIGRAQAAEQVSFVSSGGGSSLVLLEGKSLYGAERLGRVDSVTGSDHTDISGGSVSSAAVSDIEMSPLLLETPDKQQQQPTPPPLSYMSNMPLMHHTKQSKDDTVAPSQHSAASTAAYPTMKGSADRKTVKLSTSSPVSDHDNVLTPSSSVASVAALSSVRRKL
uniref:Phosphoglycerate kinase n=1 Tax=Lygus hesperus TaxID=30085 RepID=A0A0A9YI47_LYGHE